MTQRKSFKEIMLKKFFNGILALFATSPVIAQSEPLKILFIGNSYTHMNNMPGMFEKISKHAGMNVIVEKSALSGASFHVHSQRKDMFEAINKRNWDFIVLQGYSRELTYDPSHLDSATVPYLNQIIDTIYKKNACTNLLFYMTWGYEDGFQEREEVNSFEKMAAKIDTGYRYLGNMYDVPIVPVGMVWKKVKESGAMDLYDADRAHPSKHGSFLIASTFFEAIFGISSKADVGIIQESEARKVRESVSEVLIEKRAFYKLDRIYVDLETTRVEEADSEKMIVKYAVNHPHAKSVNWTFEDGKTSSAFSGTHVLSKPGKYPVRLDVITNCGVTRTYTRDLVFVSNERMRRRKES
jgi:hypothetical protein